MKKLLKIVAGLLFISSFAFANDELPNPDKGKAFKMSMYFDKTSGVVKTFYEKAQGSDLDITISDEKGRVLNGIHINKKRDRARVNFDLSGLDNGKYIVTARHNGEIISKAIKMEKVDPKYKMEAL